MSEFFLEVFTEEIPAELQSSARNNLLKLFRDFFESESIDGSVSIVTGHKNQDVEKYIKESYPSVSINFALQERALGTGDALNSYFLSNPESASEYDLTLVLCADTPLLTAKNINNLILIREIIKIAKRIY